MPSRTVFRELQSQPKRISSVEALIPSHVGKKSVNFGTAPVDHRGHPTRLTTRATLAAAAKRWTRRTEQAGTFGEQQSTFGPRSTLFASPANLGPSGGIKASPKSSSQAGYRRTNSSQIEDYFPACIPIEVDQGSLRSDEEILFIKDYIGKVWDSKRQAGKSTPKGTGKKVKPRRQQRENEFRAVLRKHDLDEIVGFESRVTTRGRRPSIIAKADGADLADRLMILDESGLVLESDDEFDGGTEVEEEGQKGAFPVKFVERNEHWIIAKLRSLASPNMNDKGVCDLFRGQDGLYAEQVRYDAVDYFVVHPYSAIKLVWDAWMLLLSVATLLGVPFGVTFDDFGFYRDWMPVCVFVDCCGMCDVVLSFRTGIIEPYRWRWVSLDSDSIVKSYLSGSFVRDLTCCVPWDFLFMLWNRSFINFHSDAAPQLRVRRAVAILSCVRVLTMFRYRFLVKKTLVLRSHMYACWIMGIAEFIPVIHCLACLHMAVPRYEGFPQNSWAVREKLLSMPISEQYSRCLVRALTITGPTQAYGKDAAPFPVLELYLSAASSIIGAYYFIVFIRRLYSGATTNDLIEKGSCEDVPGTDETSPPEETTARTSTPFHTAAAFHPRNSVVRLVTRGVGGRD